MVVLFFLVLINAVLGFLVFARNPHSRVNSLFLAIVLLICSWAVSNYFTDHSPEHLRLLLDRSSFLFPVLVSGTLAFLSRIFPAPLGYTKKGVVYLGAATIFGAVISVSGLVVKGITISSTGTTNTTPGPLYNVYSFVVVVLLFGYAVGSYLVGRRRANLLQRQQSQFVAYGFLISFFWALIVSVLLPIYVPKWGTAELGPAGTIIFVSACAYAIIRHKLFDIRLVVARSLAYVLSVLGLGFLYGIVTFLIITLVLHNPVTSIIQRVVNAALAVGLAFLFQPTKRFFDKLTNRLFYRDAYDAQEVLDQASHLMVGNVKLGSLSQTIMTLLSDTLHPEQLGVLLVDANHPIFIPLNRQEFLVEHVKTLQSDLEPLGYTITVVDELESSQLKLKGELQAAHINLVVPLKTHQTTIGYLLCGDKLSGSQYDRQDLRLLSIIADGLAIAIQNALRFEEIEHFNLTLQDKVDKATHQLRHANQRLKALDETKDDFISMASHQLRTPLTTVKGYVSMVLDGDGGKITAAQRKLLSQSFSSAQRMVYLISDLLNVSRLKTGKFILESSPVNLAEVVESEVGQLRETAEARGLELIYEKPAHFPTLLLDETKIRQVIMNFIDNAIYYTPSGGHITIRLTESEHAIELTVIDDGIGVPAHDRPHLFTKFYRASNARRARPDGTGLGLFMARKVIAAQGGAVVFRSQEGKGSTFGFTLAKAALKPPASLSFPTRSGIQ